MKTHILSFFLLAAPIAQAMEWRKHIAEELIKPSIGSVEIMKVSSDSSSIVVRVKNTTAEAIRYRGQADNRPQLFYEEYQEGKWVDTDWMWCGTGMETYTLKPGGQMEFQIPRWRTTNSIRAYVLFDSKDEKRTSLVLLYEEKK